MYRVLLFIVVLYTTTVKSQNLNYEWSNHAGSTGWDLACSNAVDAAGNVYVTGYFQDTVDFDPGPGIMNLKTVGNAVFIAKYNMSGNLIWAKSVGGPGYSISNSIAVDLSGNIYITGNFNSTVDFDPGIGIFNLTSNGFSADIFILKLDLSGNFVWAKAMGGPSVDLGNSISVDGSGNTFITGRFQGTVDFNSGPATDSLVSAGGADVFVLKLDTQGDFGWVKQAGGAFDDYGYSIALDNSGNSYITGNFSDLADFKSGTGTYTLTSTGGFDAFILKLDVSGNFKWVKQVGGTLDDAGLSCAVAPSGFIYTTGCFLATSDFDPGPGSFNLTAVGQHDAYVLKLDTAGNFVWGKQFGGTQTEIGNSITIDHNENVYITGNFYGSTDFDPGILTYTMNTLGNSDVFISCLNSAGNFKWAKSFGGTAEDHGSSIIVDSNNNLYTAGDFMVTVNFNTDPGGTDSYTSNGYCDMFLHKMSQLNVGISEYDGQGSIKIFPNPGSGLFYSEIPEGSKLTISNIFGQVLLTRIVSNEKELINLNNQPPGVYFLKCDHNKQTVFIKFIITH